MHSDLPCSAELSIVSSNIGTFNVSSFSSSLDLECNSDHCEQVKGLQKIVDVLSNTLLIKELNSKSALHQNVTFL